MNGCHGLNERCLQISSTSSQFNEWNDFSATFPFFRLHNKIGAYIHWIDVVCVGVICAFLQVVLSRVTTRPQRP
jgi:hypothetical protein